MRKTHVLATTAALAALAITAAGMPANAAPKDRVISTQPISRSGSDATDAVRDARAALAETLVGADQGLVVIDALEDSTGATHVRLRRTYDGLRVIGGDLVVHRNASGDFTGSSQTLARDLTLSTTPTISKSKALSLLKVTSSKAAKLVVDATAASPRLAWIVTRTGTQKDGTPSRLDTYVDAQTGKTIRSEQRIQTVDGDGQSLYGGTVPLKLTQSGASFQLKDPTRGNTYTIDVNNKTDSALCGLLGIGCATGTVFTSTDTHFGNGTTSSRESAAVDAQYGTDTTWDYYKTTFGRNGIFGTGAGSYNRVHYGKNYVNAFWDGTKMTYGDGNGTAYGPLTSLDVAGHEMSHGVTENTAGLTYSGESGGLNEATSDIFGTMVEFFAASASDPGDYLIGEEFDLANHAGLRRMDNPGSDGSSLNCWTSSAKNLDVHYSSGIGNHFFYLLAEGSGAKSIGGVGHNSPTCNGSSIGGIGRTAAAAIWYRALTVYMTSGTTYSGARAATLSAANDLYGTGSAQSSAVAAAWNAVSVS
ncbi:Zn-dependent metalloprotease [Aeromicrobium panaciterrae]|uniref:Neutral metalloproteinase n=1 Tax=Aeromicrobium panaciterrae TaxID=363861 RepID=A0ABU1UKK5_9ACTN|nr:M4 family metallopeptidase [Aeromicrobium panaciterrae]MDR7085696.1 Zn-dependent metalloprotease [Aeromicrobium panaciterrae]